MDSTESSRRDFVRNVGIAAGVASVVGVANLEAAPTPTTLKPDEVLAKLLEGNKRFVEGKLEHPGRSPKDYIPLAEGQAPMAIIMGCADSRVAPEVVFDQGVGDLFVVRVAGNVVDGSGPIVKGSLEFAVGVLGAKLIIVLGHSKCGAVDAAITHIEDKKSLPGSIDPMIHPIRASVIACKGKPGDKLENVIKENVKAGVRRIETLDPILSEAFKAGKLKVVGGVYDLATGKVEIVT
jgi:carbonic anhydrase